MKKILFCLIIFLMSCDKVSHYDINDYRNGFILKKTRIVDTKTHMNYTLVYDEYVIRKNDVIYVIQLDTVYGSIYKQFETIR